MNIIKLGGGLGNQMFQYAFGKVIESKGIPVRYDASWYNTNTAFNRPFGLNKFRLELAYSNFLPENMSIKEEVVYDYDPKYQSMKNSNLSGYWQNRKYYEGILPILKDEFKVQSVYLTDKYFEIKEQILLNESVALHVRRGDYLTKGHYIPPFDYYTKALDIIEEEMREYKLFVFSDDLPWCVTLFQKAVLVDLPDYLCLDLMRHCPHIITANSTFSLWAGMLKIKDGFTFAPKRWRLGDWEDAIVEREKFVPENWIRI